MLTLNEDIILLDVNQATLDLFKANDKDSGGVSKSMLKLNEAIIDIKEG